MNLCPTHHACLAPKRSLPPKTHPFDHKSQSSGSQVQPKHHVLDGLSPPGPNESHMTRRRRDAVPKRFGGRTRWRAPRGLGASCRPEPLRVQAVRGERELGRRTRDPESGCMLPRDPSLQPSQVRYDWTRQRHRLITVPNTSPYLRRYDWIILDPYRGLLFCFNHVQTQSIWD